MKSWQIYFIKMWAVFKARLKHPMHKGSYRVVKSYTPGKKKHKHLAIRIPKKDNN